MRSTTKLVLGSLGGLVAFGWWCWSLLGERRILTVQNKTLSEQNREMVDGLRRAEAERDAARQEAASLRIQMQTQSKQIFGKVAK